MKLRITVDAQTFEVEVGDLNARPVLVSVDGEAFEVWPEQENRPVVAAGAPARPAAVPTTAPVIPTAVSTNGGGSKNKVHAAPIPGVIFAVHVKEGDVISAGQEIVVLEAMKMKNSIRAHRDGKVSAVRVTQGDQVRKDQVLIEYAD